MVQREREQHAAMDELQQAHKTTHSFSIANVTRIATMPAKRPEKGALIQTIEKISAMEINAPVRERQERRQVCLGCDDGSKKKKFRDFFLARFFSSHTLTTFRRTVFLPLSLDMSTLAEQCPVCH
jgi:hypothetical protein